MDWVKMDWRIWWLWVIGIVSISLVLVSISLVLGLLVTTNGTITMEFDISQELRDGLADKDYCIFTYQAPWESDLPSVNFMGNCGYINQSFLWLNTTYIGQTVFEVTE